MTILNEKNNLVITGFELANEISKIQYRLHKLNLHLYEEIGLIESKLEQLSEDIRLFKNKELNKL